jgi:hypothetical protein
MAPRRKQVHPLSLRLSHSERLALKALADANGATPSVMVRRGLKLLGLDVEEAPGTRARNHGRLLEEEVTTA